MIEWIYENIIAIVSVIIALTAFCWTWETDGKLKKQQAQINDFKIKENAEREESKKKAVLTFSTHKVRGMGLGRYPYTALYLRVQNIGECTAKNVIVSVNSKDIDFDRIDNFTPYPELQPSKYFDLQYTSNSAKLVEVIATWSDDFSKTRVVSEFMSFGLS